MLEQPTHEQVTEIILEAIRRKYIYAVKPQNREMMDKYQNFINAMQRYRRNLK
jgi:hypothetical protein